MPVTYEQLAQMMPRGAKANRLQAHWPFINPAIEKAGIDTPKRIAMFFAQLAHESQEYRYLEDLSTGDEYEGRADLGNTLPGDGRRFKGHGPISIVGRANHLACGKALGLDLLANPRLICQPMHATASACWYWITHALNGRADQFDIRGCSKAFSGSDKGGGFDSRKAYWERYRQLLAA